MADSVATQVEALFAERWGILRPKFGDWPARIKRVFQDLDLWLADESSVYMKVDVVVPDDSFGLVEDATELNLFILTARFAVFVTIPRGQGGVLGPHTRYQVSRDRLEHLQTSLPAVVGPFEGLVFEVKYPGIPRTLSIRPNDGSSPAPDYEQEKSLFASLRDDLYATPA